MTSQARVERTRTWYSVLAGASAGNAVLTEANYPLFSPIDGAQRIGTQQVHRNDPLIRAEATMRVQGVPDQPPLRAALFGMVTASDEAMGRLAETAVWSQWLHSATMCNALHYARWRDTLDGMAIAFVPTALYCYARASRVLTSSRF